MRIKPLNASPSTPPPQKKTKNAERLEKRMFTDLKIPILKLLANKARGIETGNANLHYA